MAGHLKRKSSIAVLASVFFVFLWSVNAWAGMNLKFIHWGGIYDIHQLAAETFKKKVEANSDGKMNVTIYPGTMTNSIEEGMEFVKSGVVDLAIVSTGQIAGYYPDIQFLDLPFIINNPEHRKVVENSDVLKKIIGGTEEATGLKVLGIFSDTNGMGIASNKPIKDIADVKGMKIRCMMNPMFIDMYSNFGFIPTPMDWGELYTALQTGIVDANDLPVQSNYLNHFEELIHNFAVTNHFWSKIMIFMSGKTWAKLTPEQKALVTSAGSEAATLTDQVIVVWEKQYENRAIKDGYTVTTPDMAPFKKASSATYEKWFKKYPQWRGWYEDIQSLDPWTAKTEAARKDETAKK